MSRKIRCPKVDCSFTCPYDGEHPVLDRMGAHLSIDHQERDVAIFKPYPFLHDPSERMENVMDGEDEFDPVKNGEAYLHFHRGS